MNVKYYLKEGKTESRIILCVINNHDEMLEVSTDHKILPPYWDRDNQKAKDNMPGYEELNEVLLQLKLDVMKQVRVMRLEGVSGWEGIRERLIEYFQKGDDIKQDKKEKKLPDRKADMKEDCSINIFSYIWLIPFYHCLWLYSNETHSPVLILITTVSM